MQLMHRMTTDLMEQQKEETGPLGRLKIGDKIGEGGYGVVHLGECWGPS